MKPKVILCITFVLSVFICSLATRGEDTNTVHNEKYPGVGNVRTINLKMPGLNDTVFFNEQPTLFTVQIIVDGYRDNKEHITPKAGDLHRQVWLLRADGTAISQSQEPAVISISNAGWSNDYLIFGFQKKSTNEVAGIVVSVNGKLYCRELDTR
jgi:hypothetical protein